MKLLDNQENVNIDWLSSNIMNLLLIIFSYDNELSLLWKQLSLKYICVNIFNTYAYVIIGVYNICMYIYRWNVMP